MAKQRISTLLCATAGLAALVYTIPVLGQQGPESLLPPGFNDPPPPPTARPAPPASSPSTSRPTEAVPGSPVSGTAAGTDTGATDEEADAEEDEEEEDTEPRYDVPPTARRSLKAVGSPTAHREAETAKAHRG